MMSNSEQQTHMDVELDTLPEQFADNVPEVQTSTQPTSALDEMAETIEIPPADVDQLLTATSANNGKIVKIGQHGFADDNESGNESGSHGLIRNVIGRLKKLNKAGSLSHNHSQKSDIKDELVMSDINNTTESDTQEDLDMSYGKAIAMVVISSVIGAVSALLISQVILEDNFQIASSNPETSSDTINRTEQLMQLNQQIRAAEERLNKMEIEFSAIKDGSDITDEDSINSRLLKMENIIVLLGKKVMQLIETSREVNVQTKKTAEVNNDSMQAKTVVEKKAEIVKASYIVANQTMTSPPLVSDSGLANSWVINLFSYKEKYLADEKALKYKADGIDNIEVKQFEKAGKSWYRVRIVGYQTKSEASKDIAQLPDYISKTSPWVGRYNPGSLVN